MYDTAPIMEIAPFIIIVLVIISLFFFLGTKGSGEPMVMFPLVVLGFLAQGVFITLIGFFGGIVLYIVTATTLIVLYYKQKEKKENLSLKPTSKRPIAIVTHNESRVNIEEDNQWRDYLFYLKDSLSPEDYASLVKSYKASGVLSEDFKAP